MEDYFVLNYEPSEDEHKLEFAFFGIFDGHGGKEAARFAKDRLMNFIVSDKRFWSEEDDDVCQAITSGFLQTHYAMWQDQGKSLHLARRLGSCFWVGTYFGLILVALPLWGILNACMLL